MYKICQNCFSNYTFSDKKEAYAIWDLFLLLTKIKLLPISLSWKSSYKNADLFIYSYSSSRFKNIVSIERSEFSFKHTMYVVKKTNLFRKKWVDIEIYYENKALKFLQNRDNNALKAMQNK